MHKLTLLLLTSPLLALAQSITVVSGDWQGEGVVLVPPSSAEFGILAQSLLPPETASQVNPLYSQSFILSNATARTIIAYSMRWEWTDPVGQRRIHDVVYSETHLPAGIGQILPQSSRLVTPVLDLGISATPVPLAMQKARDAWLQRSSGAQSLKVSLETIVLDDGTILGKDENNAAANIQANMDAERELLLGIGSAAGGPVPGDALAAYLRPIGSARVPSLIEAANQVSSQAAYQEFYSYHRIQLAQHFLSILETHGAVRVAAVAANALAAQRPVTFHR
jgi:hypothetical protein